MRTDERIIEAAVRLFNVYGITQVSLRDIAEEIGISHGNLAYHYANKGAILEEIYARMAREMDDAVYPASDASLRHYHALLRRISAFHDRYRFFYLDMLEIARQYPRVIRRYRKTIALRFEQYDRMMSHLVANGLVRPEPVPGLYRSLFHSIWVVSTFWLQHKRILGEGHPVIGDGDDIRHVWEIMMPHLTAKGLREFRLMCSEDAMGESGRPLLVLHLRKAVAVKHRD